MMTRAARVNASMGYIVGYLVARRPEIIGELEMLALDPDLEEGLAGDIASTARALITQARDLMKDLP